jgi:hypothetical protein
MQAGFPMIGSRPMKQSTNPVHPPIGGFYSLQNISLTEPSRAFHNNLFVATNRANGTVPENAMTPDVYSHFWSM